MAPDVRRPPWRPIPSAAICLDLHRSVGPRDAWVGGSYPIDEGSSTMQQTKEIAKTGKRMGKKVMATDTAQDVVGVVVDGLEDVTVEKADDVAENVKVRAARAGGRSPKRAAPKKSSARKPKKTTAKKKSTAKKSTAKKSTAKKSTAKKSTAKKSTAKKSTAKKSTAKKSTAKKKSGAKKSAAKRAGAKKSTAKKSAARKSTAKKSTTKRR
jgi:hypothetical protein